MTLSDSMRASEPASQPERLSPKFERLLRYGDRDGVYESNSALQNGIILSAINRGVSKELMFERLSHPQNKGGFGLSGDLRGVFDAEWERALAFVRANPVPQNVHDVRHRVVVLREVASGESWPGTAGGTDHSVLLAVLGIADRTGSLIDVGLSVREVAELAGIAVGTASRSLRRLSDRGWLRRTVAARGAESAKYCLRQPKRTERNNHPGHSCIRDPDCSGQFADDCWRHPPAGLGKQKYRIWRLLSDQSAVSTAEIAQEMQRGVRTIQKHLAGLAFHGLAVGGKSGWFRGPASPEEVARQLGVAGIGAKQKARHQDQREQFRDARIAMSPNAPTVIDPDTGELLHVHLLRRAHPAAGKESN